MKNKFNQGYYKVYFNLAFAKIALNTLKIEQGVQQMLWILMITRKYPLRGYFLGVLTHTTAWD